tara:strand:+ start:534 stop:1118 length:585 start_codon:yes stop_codon:yes gene_type:complete
VSVDRDQIYRVVSGDTLYSIAWSCRCDVIDLITVNGLSPPFTIYPGQSLKLPSAVIRKKTGRSATRKKVKINDTRRANWDWPVKEKILQPFGGENQGIDYRLSKDSSVFSAGDGEVVYSGSGLGGFAYLIIIKHGSEYLSAYSFNAESFLEEGQVVKLGDPIATIKKSTPNAGSFHFEIRRNGIAVDPARLMPR